MDKAQQDHLRAPVVLVLASGRGERFRASGGEGSKLQAQLGGRTVLERTLAAVRASGLPFHVEDRGHAGMGDSIAAAVRATPDVAGWLVLPGDLPFIAPQSLRAVAQALAPDTVVRPFFNGQAAHPVGFGRGLGAALMALAGPHGAQPVVAAAFQSGQGCRIDLQDPGCAIDIDTVADLDAARRRLQGP